MHTSTMNTDYRRAADTREIREAIRAGETALSCLYDARDSLNSAGTWGLVDIFGGNLISGLLKHSKIEDAKRSMTEARNALSVFQRELRDVDAPSLQVGINGFLTFADFFFDGFVVDILMQSKIGKAKEQVDDAIRRVEDMLRQLRAM